MAADHGADVIKIFPAEFFGPAYIKSLRAVFPGLKFLPTGGVTTKTLPDFLKAGAFAAAAGSSPPGSRRPQGPGLGFHHSARPRVCGRGSAS